MDGPYSFIHGKLFMGNKSIHFKMVKLGYMCVSLVIYCDGWYNVSLGMNEYLCLVAYPEKILSTGKLSNDYPSTWASHRSQNYVRKWAARNWSLSRTSENVVARLRFWSKMVVNVPQNSPFVPEPTVIACSVAAWIWYNAFAAGYFRSWHTRTHTHTQTRLEKQGGVFSTYVRTKVCNCARRIWAR